MRIVKAEASFRKRSYFLVFYKMEKEGTWEGIRKERNWTEVAGGLLFIPLYGS